MPSVLYGHVPMTKSTICGLGVEAFGWTASVTTWYLAIPVFIFALTTSRSVYLIRVVISPFAPWTSAAFYIRLSTSDCAPLALE